MKLFICWSGTRSLAIASVLKRHLEDCCGGCSAFVSTEDIKKGDEWWKELYNALANGDMAMPVILQENMHSPWIHFEIGAFLRENDTKMINPFLVDVDLVELPDPLSKYQSTRFDKEDFRKLFCQIFKKIESGQPDDSMFDNTWEKISREIKDVLNEPTKTAFLEDFATKCEPPLTYIKNGEQRISRDRAYRFLLYMFHYAEFTEFRAFDLAFSRWKELLDSKNEDQTFNISSQIFKEVGDLLETHRCEEFRRILVAGQLELTSLWGKKILRKIHGTEQRWRDNKLNVETKVLINPGRGGRILSDIYDIGDIALFTSEKEQLAITEPSLSKPCTNEKACVLVTSKSSLNKMQIIFDKLFMKDAKNIHEFI